MVGRVRDGRWECKLGDRGRREPRGSRSRTLRLRALAARPSARRELPGPLSGTPPQLPGPTTHDAGAADSPPRSSMVTANRPRARLTSAWLKPREGIGLWMLGVGSRPNTYHLTPNTLRSSARPQVPVPAHTGVKAVATASITGSEYPATLGVVTVALTEAPAAAQLVSPVRGTDQPGFGAVGGRHASIVADRHPSVKNCSKTGFPSY